ncbi:MAG: hypothetical protein ACRC2O_06410, partial [Chitinophagaceae bacterium]
MDSNTNNAQPLSNEALIVVLNEKSAELDQLRKELTVESSLEKVRACALAMKEPADMLEICRVISGQLILLGVKEIRNVQTAIIYPDKGTYLNFEYYLLHDKKIITEVDYTLHKAQQDFANQMMGGPEIFHEVHFSGKELKDWIEYQNTTTQFVDSFLYTAESLNYYFYSMGPVALGVSAYAPLKTENLILIKRFRNVFELAYTRFVDIQQAEAQEREAKIELALERVRARTMAMQKSDELPDAANLLFLQMQTLGMPAWSAGYCIWDEDKQGVTLWMSSEGLIQPPFHAPLTDDPTFIHMREAYDKGENFHVEAVGGDELVSHYKYMRTLPVVGRILDSIIEAGHPLPVFQIMHCAYFSQGFLLFITYESMPQAWDIFKRFSNVFDQTYTRFLDLQKAEEQAREAQIQLSLERVRARTMAMQRSDELLDLIKMISEQLQLLEIKFDNVLFGINSEGYDFDFWLASTRYDKPARRHVPYINNPIPNRVKEAQKSGLKFFTDTATKEEFNEWMQIVFEHNKTGEKEKTYLLERPGFARTTSILKNINMFMVNYVPHPFAAEENDIFVRFANVFEQSYIRFLDLQKVETQAREAQIESALEKVRSRTMAMQKSDELADAAFVLFQQLNHLGVIHERINIGIVKEETNSIDFWITE